MPFTGQGFNGKQVRDAIEVAARNACAAPATVSGIQLPTLARYPQVARRKPLCPSRAWEGGDACRSAPTLRAAAFRKPGYRPSALLSDAAGVRLSGPAPACAAVAGSGVRAVRRGSDDRPRG